jgi:hypothetical protein
MNTVEEILNAVVRLSSRQRERFFKQLEKIEQQSWQAERKRVGQRLAAEGLTDAKIDHFIERRRREKRV